MNEKYCHHLAESARQEGVFRDSVASDPSAVIKSWPKSSSHNYAVVGERSWSRFEDPQIQRHPFDVLLNTLDNTSRH